VKIQGYKDKILNESTRILFFFCNEKYFMGEYSIEQFVEVKNQLAKSIIKKYGIEASDDQIDQFYIEDQQGSVICFYDDGFTLFVKYFNPSCCHFYEKLRISFLKL
jgi:hypothetical protein